MQLIQVDFPLVVMLVAGVCAPLAGWSAARRGRSPVVWFVFGALLGPVAIVLIAIAPPGRCPACDVPVPGWAGWCASCGTRLGGLGARGAPPVVRSASPDSGAVGAPGSVASIDAVLDRGSRRTRGTRRSTPTPVTTSVVVPALVPDPAGRPGDDGPAAGEVLATGVYLSGNARLEIGACYALSRVDDRWRVFGPVDAGQITIRHEGPLASLDVTGMDDRVILHSVEGRSELAIVFRSVGGMRPADLERALAPRGIETGEHQAAGDRPDPGARGVAS